MVTLEFDGQMSRLIAMLPAKEPEGLHDIIFVSSWHVETVVFMFK